jgi:hypothetical protein
MKLGASARRHIALTLTTNAEGEFVMSDKSAAQSRDSNQTPMGVFALLTAKPGVTREQVMAIMPAEIRATVQLYLDGKIREWYTREDGRGAVFLLNAGNLDDAKSILESLPLAHENLMDHEYIPVGPLMPLRLLLGSAPTKP